MANTDKIVAIFPRHGHVLAQLVVFSLSCEAVPAHCPGPTTPSISAGLLGQGSGLAMQQDRK